MHQPQNKYYYGTREGFRIICIIGSLFFLLVVFIPKMACAQRVDSTAHTEDSSISPKDSLWLMASFSGAFIFPSGPEGGNIFGVACKIGMVWRNQIFQFDYSTNWVRRDYALLFGNSHRSTSIFSNFAAGISIVNYIPHGDTIYNQFNRLSIGLDILAEFYATPVPYWGVFGMGLYGSLASGNSMIAIEISIPIEFNLPIPLK